MLLCLPWRYQQTLTMILNNILIDRDYHIFIISSSSKFLTYVSSVVRFWSMHQQWFKIDNTIISPKHKYFSIRDQLFFCSERKESRKKSDFYFAHILIFYRKMHHMKKDQWFFHWTIIFIHVNLLIYHANNLLSLVNLF